MIANGTAQPYPAKPDAIKAQLSGQLAEPVRFRESIDALYAHGCRVFLEVGAGSVLTGLAGKCLADRPHVAISLDTAARHGLRSGGAPSAELATLGLPLRFDQLHASFGETLPTARAAEGSRRGDGRRRQSRQALSAVGCRHGGPCRRCTRGRGAAGGDSRLRATSAGIRAVWSGRLPVRGRACGPGFVHRDH